SPGRRCRGRRDGCSPRTAAMAAPGRPRLRRNDLEPKRFEPSAHGPLAAAEVRGSQRPEIGLLAAAGARPIDFEWSAFPLRSRSSCAQDEAISLEEGVATEPIEFRLLVDLSAQFGKPAKPTTRRDPAR